MVGSAMSRGGTGTRTFSGLAAVLAALAFQGCGSNNGKSMIPDGGIAEGGSSGNDGATDADPADTIDPAPGTCAVVQRRTVSTGGPTQTPSIAWSNGNYQVVWNDSRSGSSDVFTTWLNPDGSRRAGASDTMVAHTGFVTTAVRSSPLSNGRSLFVWEDCRPTLPDCTDGTSVAALMVDQNGAPMGAVTNLTGVAIVQRRPYVISALGGAYVSFREIVGPTTVAQVIHLADSGALTGEGINLGSESAGLYPFIASGNGELAAVFSRGVASGDIVLTRLNASLVPLASLVVRTGATPATNPVTVWNGSGWMVAWEEATTGSVQARTALATADASAVGESRLLQASEGDWPQMASQGGDTGVAFYGFPNNAQIMFARFNSAGQGVGPVIQISDDAGRARYPSIATSDRNGDFGVVWSDEKSGELIFAEVECR